MNAKTNLHVLARAMVWPMMFAVLGSGRAAVEQDILFSYAPSYATSLGGEANTQVSFANLAVAVNALYDQSGAGAHWHVAGYYESYFDPVNWTTTGGMVGWLSGNNGNVSDVVSYGGSVGADLVLYVVQNSDSSSIAGVTQQPGTYGVVNPGSVWSAVVAHEIGGHAYGCNHQDGKLSPKTIMMHNYCGGGSAPPYYFSNPNMWWNGVHMIGDGQNSCLGGSAINGDDNTYCLSANAQGVTDRRLRVVYGPVLNQSVFHWSFTNAPGAAPAGTTNYDLVSGAPAVVRGNGAAYTGSALRIPGGTTGNINMNAMSAYLDLPNGIISSQVNLTIEVWATPLSAPSWARILDFGRTTEGGDVDGISGEWSGLPGTAAPGATSSYSDIMLSAAEGTSLNSQRLEAKLTGTNFTFDSALATTAGVQHHYAITFTDGAGSYGSAGGRWQWYRDGYTVTYVDVNFHLSAIPDVNNWLGRSLWSGDANANNDYAEVRISNVAMNQWQILANYQVGPNYVPASATLVSSDLWNGSTRSFNAAGNWSDGLPPSAGKTYEMSDFNLTTPSDTASYTFAGDALHASRGIFFCGASGSSTITVNKFMIDGEEICSTASGTCALAGNLYVTNDCVVRGAGGSVNLAANLSGNGSLTLYGNTAAITGSNTNFTGKIRIGNGIIGNLSLGSEAQLGANPPVFTADQLSLNRGWLYTTANLTISNSNRGIQIGMNDGLINVAGGTTLTLGSPVTSPAFPSGVVGGILWKQNSGTLALTSPSNTFYGPIQIDAGTLSVAGPGVLAGGNYGSPYFLNSGIFDYSSSAAQTISSSISGSGSITENGTGTLTLSGTNTMSGSVTINHGTLYANPGDAANNCAFSYVSAITINSGGTLQSGANGLFGWDGTQGRPITVNAGGTLTCDAGWDVGVSNVILNGGTLANLGASTAFGSWRFDQAGDQLLVTDNSTISAVNVKFGSPAAFINVAAGKILTVNGTITDATSGGASYLTLSNGTGTVLLSGVNTCTGAATVNAGRLALTNNASLASSNIFIGNGATFDVSGLATIFTVGSAQALAGSGLISGSVTTVAGAKIYAGADGGYGTNTFNQNLTLVSGAAVCLDLGVAAMGTNDKLVVLGNLNLTNTVFHLKAPSFGSNLDPGNDYTLVTVAGTLSGSVNAAPVWDVQPGNYGAFAVMVTNGNKIVLHAVAAPPSFAGGAATPASVGRNQTIFISAAVNQGLYSITSVTANTTNLGGPAALPLAADGAGNYTNSIAATPDTTFGLKTMLVTATDSGNISSVTNLPVTVAAASRVWSGGSVSDNNWGSNPNWSTLAAPGFIGDGVVFDGVTRTTPFLETNYSVTGVTFNGTAGGFTLGTALRFLTLSGSGVTNNSPFSQTINVPISLGMAQTFSAVAGNLAFTKNITNNGNVLTVGGNSNTLVSGVVSGAGGLAKTGNGTASLSANNTYNGPTTVAGGALNVSGTVPNHAITTVGSAAANAVLLSSGTLTQSNLFVGNAVGAVGAVFQTGGTVTVQGGSGDNFDIGNIAGGFGYYDASGGTLAAAGIAVGGENNTGSGFSGTGGNGILELNGGTINDTSWLVMARGVTNETGVLNVFSGTLDYAGGGIANCWGIGQTAIVNVLGGTVANTAAVGINLNESGNVTNTAILNLNGGIVQGYSLGGTAARVNFNGGSLRASAANNSLLTGVGSACIYSNGATINDSGYAVGVSQSLLAPAGKGVNGIASFTPGAGYIAPPMVAVVRGAGDATGVGATAIAQVDVSTGNPTSGQMTNVLITCPGVNYTQTPTFTLNGGGATTPATITGQPPTANASGGLTKAGAGTLTLAGVDTYTGGTTISAGTLKLLSSSAPVPTPLLYLSFDNVSGSTVVNQGTGGAALNGTLTGTATIVSGGINGGNALSIPSGAANAAYVLITNPVVAMTGAASWTIAMWVKTATAGGVYAYQGSGGWASGNMTFYLNEGSDSGYGAKAGGVSYAQGWEEGSTTVNDGNWHFLVMTCNGSTKAMYVDGNVDTIVSSWAANTGVGSQLWIGGSADTSDEDLGLGGLIDGVSVYNSALSQAQIQALYTNNLAGPSVLPATTAVSVAAGATLDVGGVSQVIGSLSGPSGSSVILADVTNATGVFTIGNASNTIFAGTISGAGSLTKAGAGTLTLSGANTYLGITVVSNGTLAVNNASGSATGTGPVTVLNGGNLSGNGVVGGAVAVNSGGLLIPGNPLGTITIKSNLTVTSGGSVLVQVQHSPLTNGAVKVTGTVTYGGTLMVTNFGGSLLAGDTFQIFSATNYTGTFAVTSLPALANYLYWTNNLAVNGTLAVVSGASTAPTRLAWLVSGTNMSLSWPADHTGWRLLMQTNDLVSGISLNTNNWATVAGSPATNQINLPINPTLPGEFFRLVYP